MSVQGLAQLNRRLARLPRSAKIELEKAVEEGAQRVAVLAKALAPHKSGALAGSIHVEQGNHALQRLVVAGGEATTVEVRKGSGADYDYSLGQEFGTKNMEKNPSLLPAFRSLRKSIKAKMNRAFRKSLKGGA